jgi:hypothetical protein
MSGLLQQLHGDRKAATEKRWRKTLDGEGDTENDGRTPEEEGNDSGAATDVATDDDVDESMSDADTFDEYEAQENILIVN